MAAASAEQLKADIQTAGETLGKQMEAAIPLRPNRLATIVRAVQFSERILVPVEGEEGVFTRAWLERKAAMTTAKSPIELLTDTVDVDPTRKDQANQFAKDPVVAAVYDPSNGLEVREDLGTPQEETLARIGELGSYVTAIAEAELHRELKKAVPIHHLKVQGINA